MLSLAAGTIPELGPADFVSTCAEAGWDGAGVWFNAKTWTDAVAADVRQRFDDTGLVPLDIEPIFITDDGDWGDRLVDAAATIGARNILTVGLGVSVQQFVDRFGELCDRAAPAGVTVNVEFGRLFSIADLDTAVEVLARVDRPNAGVLFDNLHLDRCGLGPSDVAGTAAESIHYAQFCDGPAQPGPDLRTDAVDDRVNPGEGGLPVAEFVAALPPGTPLSAEIRSKALREGVPDPLERARLVLAACRPLGET